LGTCRQPQQSRCGSTFGASHPDDSTANAADHITLVQDNFEILSEELFKQTPTHQNGAPNTIVGPPTSGAHVESEIVGEFPRLAATLPSSTHVAVSIEAQVWRRMSLGQASNPSFWRSRSSARRRVERVIGSAAFRVFAFFSHLTAQGVQ
jgi:hypothetical protein